MQRTLRLSCCPLFLAAGCISTACGSWARRRGRPVHPTGRRAGGEAGPALHRPRRPHVEQLGGVRQLRRPPPEDGHRDGVARRGRIDSRTGAPALDPDLQHRQLGRVGAEGWRVRSSPAVPIVSCTMSSSAGNSRSDSVPWTVRGVRQPARGHGTHEHLVDHTRQAADVGPRVHVVPARRLLGAHVPRRPDGHAGPGERLVAGLETAFAIPKSVTSAWPSDRSTFSGFTPARARRRRSSSSVIARGEMENAPAGREPEKATRRMAP